MTQNNNKPLKKILLNNKSGVTLNFNLTKDNHKKGFYVSLTNNFGRDLNKLIGDFNSLKESIKVKQKTYIGFWFDEKESIFYLDISVYCIKQETALNIAKKFNQKAIFDIKNLNSIYLND